ncbi:MAG: winged helix-turn-helix transcriptional regulator [Nocardiopsaceae bacterium]|nr:winged helix-turn-helix transcriptional regulator [Nocardiopsaceae bacterium]
MGEPPADEEAIAKESGDKAVVDGTAVDEAVIDAVLAASRTMVAVVVQSLGSAAEETTIAQYRVLVVLALHGPKRMVDLAGAVGVAPSTAGRMCDRLVRKGLIRRHRARADRRAVLVSLTAAGRKVFDDATASRRELLAGILARLPVAERREVADGLGAFARAAGDVPDSQWSPAVPGEPSFVPSGAGVPVPRERP